MNPNSSDSRNGDAVLRMRDVNVWIEHKTAGRLTLGRITNSGQNGLIDLGGTQVGVGSDPACTGGGLKFRRSGGVLGPSISDLSFGCGGPIGIRMEGIKYTSPAVMGFIFDASIGESLKVETSTLDQANGTVTNLGRVMGANLKYAGEYGGVRIAAGVGAEWSKANEDDSKNFLTTDAVLGIGGSTANGGFGFPGTNLSADNRYYAGALSLMHVPSGLFAQGHYTKLTVKAQNSLITGGFDPGKDAHRWDIQAGIAKNWFGLGNTVVYGEYGKHDNFKFSGDLYDCNGTTTPGVGGGTCNSLAAPTNLKGDELKFWGIGFVQNIDAAATELYVDWRRYSAKDPANAQSLQDLDIVVGGARVKF
jgi:hypothetical protein